MWLRSATRLAALSSATALSQLVVEAASPPPSSAEHTSCDLRSHLRGREPVLLSMSLKSRCVARPRIALSCIHWNRPDRRKQVARRVRDEPVSESAFAAGSFGVCDCALGGWKVTVGEALQLAVR